MLRLHDLDPRCFPTLPSVASVSTQRQPYGIADKIKVSGLQQYDQTTCRKKWTAEIRTCYVPSTFKSGVELHFRRKRNYSTCRYQKKGIVVGIEEGRATACSRFPDRNLGFRVCDCNRWCETMVCTISIGRKDPFVGSTEIYDINGTSKSTGATIATGKVTFAKAVQTPATFYTYGSSNNDWASPNNYTSKNWNDISESDGKTFFDPCPEGWRLPTKAEYSNFSTTTFTWDATNSGRTYNGNWFPAAGYRNSDDGSMSSVGSLGYCWSASPNSEYDGYLLSFDSGYVNPASSGYRAYGFSVRCVQE